SLFGAIFLDHGIEVSKRVIMNLFEPIIERSGRLGAGLDWKTSLQELSAERSLGQPQYQITSTGPDHDKEFTAVAVVGGAALGQGVGKTKKEAEQNAAELAWKALRDQADQ
ncbi:putative dsRNA-binding protein, partial [Gordonia sp. (in: high G+C Gram-positive bacteria)]|uniref:ribonuclease III family protein n=1 Tax=Gordonia sp. (in: high G+C Gram-positive bacteria) TaxID=84139 RepID=UPI0016B3115F